MGAMAINVQRLLSTGLISQPSFDQLCTSMDAGKNILIVGGRGRGKTLLVAALLEATDDEASRLLLTS